MADAPTRELPEAQIATLREVAERVAGGCPFKPGELVMARQGCGLTEPGLPNIVVEMFSTPVRHHEQDGLGLPDHLCLLDMRVARIGQSGTVNAFAVESWRFEAYAREGA